MAFAELGGTLELSPNVAAILAAKDELLAAKDAEIAELKGQRDGAQRLCALSTKVTVADVHRTVTKYVEDLHL